VIFARSQTALSAALTNRQTKSSEDVK